MDFLELFFEIVDRYVLHQFIFDVNDGLWPNCSNQGFFSEIYIICM